MIYIFSFSNFQNIDTIDTYDNPKGNNKYYLGIIGVSGDKSIDMIAFPDKTKGHVTVKSYGNI